MPRFEANSDVVKITQRELDRKLIAQQERAEELLVTKAERVKPVSKLLRRHSIIGVVAMDGASTEDFEQGLNHKIGKRRVLWLPADPNVQGHNSADIAYEEHKREEISHLRRQDGFVVVAFRGVDFSGQSGTGTPGIFNRVCGLIQEQQGRKLRQRDLGVLALGSGQPCDLETHPDHDYSGQQGFPSLAVVRRALSPEGELLDLYGHHKSRAELGDLPVSNSIPTNNETRLGIDTSQVASRVEKV